MSGSFFAKGGGALATDQPVGPLFAMSIISVYDVMRNAAAGSPTDLVAALKRGACLDLLTCRGP